ncbi:hypothetical protein KP509_17G058300 [Ceratopteris richardii]|uniref:Glutaredoxin-like protein n=1 Tax=Ceratopteris richardii TaxID=49495 RepID=A0A8T2SZS1_CERRI|nr:hypothetical protein KP509_17G058300 [Ceratopteris richardii]
MPLVYAARLMCLPMAVSTCGSLVARSSVSTATLRQHSPLTRHTKACVRAFCVPHSAPPPTSRKLVLYSKPGCCLCDNLKEKLQAVLILGGPESLADVLIEVRDITTNAAWETAYQYEIPVLARVNEDNSEVCMV